MTAAATNNVNGHGNGNGNTNSGEEQFNGCRRIRADLFRAEMTIIELVRHREC